MSDHKPAQRPPDHTDCPDALVLPLSTLNRTLLPLVGGKAAQLGELIRAGFAVPAGFCVTTIAYARIAASAELEMLLRALSTIPPTDAARQAELAAAVRTAILPAPVPPDITAAITEAYQTLGQGETVPVSVFRPSA